MVDQALHFLKRKELQAFAIAFACAYTMIPFFFDAAVWPLSNTGATWLSLDPSWQIALNKAYVDDLTWGSDIIFTYGPFSSLVTRIGWGHSKWFFFLFDLFTSFNLFYMFYVGYMRSKNLRLTVFLILSSTFMLPDFLGSVNALLLQAFLIFWIRESLDAPRPFYYVMQIVIVAILFFLKFNTGLVSIVFFGAGLAYNLFFTKNKKWPFFVYLAVPLVLVFLMARLLNVSLPEYVKGGMNMVSGYNEIMYLEETYPQEFRFGLLAIGLALAVLLYKTYVKRGELLKNLVIAFIFTASLYILYKQAFTRNDIQHIREFYKCLLFLVFCIHDFHYEHLGHNVRAAMLGIVFITVFFGKRGENILFATEQRLFKGDYWRGFDNYSDTANLHLFGANLLPDTIRKQVGSGTVDVYPWNIHLLLENNLNYSPRPAFQSYTAYTPYLEELNFDFYNSNKAPQHVVYEFDAIDNRYALFDETKVNLQLLRNYRLADTFNFSGRMHLLLDKKPGFVKTSLRKIRDYELGQEAEIVPAKDVYYEVFIDHSLKGKLRSVLYRSPGMALIVKTRDGNSRYFKTSRKLLETGIFGDRFFASVQDVYHYMKGDSLSTANEIVSYTFKLGNPGMFGDKIKITEYKIE